MVKLRFIGLLSLITIFLNCNNNNHNKNYFSNSYAESINLNDNILTVKNTYQQPVRFEVVDFGKDTQINETINMADMAEVIWLTKYLGDYNICKYGNDLVLENKGYLLKLRRI